MTLVANNRPGRPNRSRIETLELRSKIVDLARAGHTYRSIAEMVGFDSHASVVQHLALYRATLTPSSELAEEWRESKLARADERFRRLGGKALGVQAADGSWEVEPDYQALAALQKEEDAISKLLGANVEQGGIRVQITREALAELLYADDTVVEGEAVELAPAAELEAGGDDA